MYSSGSYRARRRSTVYVCAGGKVGMMRVYRENLFIFLRGTILKAVTLVLEGLKRYKL